MNPLARLVDLRPGEGVTAALAMLYFFCLLAGYFVLRPVRESLGLLGGADRLPLLFTGSLVAMVVVTPIFAWMVTRFRRRIFIPSVYAISIACLALFWIAFRFANPERETALAYVFYVFVSVFNLFIVSVFWGFMADIWRLDQAKRLFGFIGAAGTLGAIVGGQMTRSFVTAVGTVNMLLVSIAFMTAALLCVVALMRVHAIDSKSEAVERFDGDVWRGMRLVASTPYLRAVAAYVFLHGLIGTYLYMQQGQIVEASIASRDERTALFALIDTVANALTLFVQLFLTSRLIRWFGVTFALVSQPAIAFLGWIVLALAMFQSARLAASGFSPGGLVPELAVLVGFQVLLRASNYATVRPAREALFTVVEREVKYKSKSFIDTFVYRFGDGVGAWTYLGMLGIGAALPVISVAVVPLAGAWIGVGAVLGRRQRALSNES
ncbi:MAG: Npt1/Npt2 family nucleotide transporter [Planctomycetota bacterium]|nr:Npt1/Npt2 family nucleotide transporter [Planctomycetota bacterium]